MNYSEAEATATFCAKEIVSCIDILAVNVDSVTYMREYAEFLRSRLSVQESFPYAESQSAAIRTRAELETLNAIIALVDIRVRSLQSVAKEAESQSKLRSMFKGMGI